MAKVVGELNLVQQAYESEYRIAVLEKLVALMLNRMPVVGRVISDQEVQEIQKQVIEQLQRKYPTAGIELRSDAEKK